MFIDYNQGELLVVLRNVFNSCFITKLIFNQWVWFDRLLSYSMSYKYYSVIAFATI